MQKILLISLFFFAASFLKAGDLPKLNLEIGKKYTIETVYLEDTSKTNPRREYDKKIFEFTPTGFDKNKGIYEVKLVISYFMHVRQEINKQGVWSEKEVYETGYPSTFSRPVVFMNMHQVPVRFSLTNEGKITNFDFSDYERLKIPNGFEPHLAEGDQDEIEGEIRILFFDCKEIRMLWAHEFGLRSDYRIIKENETFVEAEVYNQEKVVPEGKYTSSKEQYKRKILIDKPTGLILEEKLSYIWNFMGKRNVTRYQKWIPVFSDKFEAYQKTSELEYKKIRISKPNTAIQITVQDSTEYPKFMFLTYFDPLTNTSRLVKLEKERNGVFNFQMHLDQPTSIKLMNSSGITNNARSELVYLRPGDHLEVEITKQSDSERIIFKGIGAEENRLSNRIRRVLISKNNSNKLISNTLASVKSDSTFQILNSLKSSIDPELYLEIGNTLLYSKFLWQSSDSINNLKVPICNTLAARNIFYQYFLSRYVASFMGKIRQSSTNYKPSSDQYERQYSFGTMLFPEPILTEYLASTVEEALLHGKWSNARLLYERHILTSLKTPRTLKTELIYQQQARFTPGAQFPIESLTDINGNTINFRKEKNKLVIISINNIFTATNLVSETESWKQSGRDYVNFRDNIIQVRFVIGMNDQLSKLKAALRPNSEEKIVFLNIEELFFGDIQLSPLLNKGKVIVLGRDGIILYDKEVDSMLLQNAIEELQMPHFLKGASNFVLKLIATILLGVLLLTALAFVVYRQISRRKLKQAELSRKMRELELTVIRTRMNPHFMYNCLNSIQNLVQKNQNEEAHLYLSKFASLVRQVLNNSKKDEISLSKELDSVKEYIELEQLRFDFDFRIVLAEGIDMNGIFVPPMLLQPFVENAILHGLMLKKDNRLLEIHVLKEQSKITLVVEDNGVGREAAGKSDQKGNGQGILLCRNRLSLLSEKTGIHYELKIEDLTDENQQPTGTRVSIGFVEEE